MKYTFSLALFLISFSLNAQYKTTLKGKIINQKNDVLILAQSYKDFRYNGVEIPMKASGQFEYILEHDFIEEYSFVFKSELKNGMWRPITFFPEGKYMEFELYPSTEFDQNVITGSELLKGKLKYQNEFSDRFMSIGNDIYGKFFQSADGSKEKEIAKTRLDSLNSAALEFQYEYFKEDTTILGLNEYVNTLQSAEQMQIPISQLAKYQREYIEQDYDHPLLDRAVNLYTALSNVKVGQKFVDIVLVDDKEIIENLSEKLSKNKFTVLDLWATWCGPCISKSKVIKSNYKVLQSKIHVISVVGGIDNKEDATKTLTRLNYPWISYFEIADKNKIWEKYGISNSGGAQFLINTTGKIVAINPTLDEIKKLIELE